MQSNYVVDNRNIVLTFNVLQSTKVDIVFSGLQVYQLT